MRPPRTGNRLLRNRFIFTTPEVAVSTPPNTSEPFNAISLNPPLTVVIAKNDQ